MDTKASITKAYYKLARQHHPDKKKAHDNDATFKLVISVSPDWVALHTSCIPNDRLHNVLVLSCCAAVLTHKVLTDDKRREVYDRIVFMCIEDKQAGIALVVAWTPLVGGCRVGRDPGHRATAEASPMRQCIHTCSLVRNSPNVECLTNACYPGPMSSDPFITPVFDGEELGYLE